MAQCECLGEEAEADWYQECQRVFEKDLFGHLGSDASSAEFWSHAQVQADLPVGPTLLPTFSASTICAKPGVPSLLVYPEKPEMVSPDFVSKAYDADDPPVSKDLPDLNYLVLNHIPVRSTSKLLLQEEATPARNMGSSKSTKITSADALQSMADGFVSRMEQVLVNLAGANGGGHAALQNQAARFQDDTMVFKPKNTVLALPSSVMEQSTASVAGPPTQQPCLPYTKPLGYYYMECASCAMSCCFLFFLKNFVENSIIWYDVLGLNPLKHFHKKDLLELDKNLLHRHLLQRSWRRRKARKESLGQKILWKL